MDPNSHENPDKLDNLAQFALDLLTKLSVITEVSPAHSLAGDFLWKNTLASMSIRNILFPPQITDPASLGAAFLQIDYASGFVLLRTLFYGYINMHYVLLDPSTPDEAEFRLLEWTLSEQRAFLKHLTKGDPRREPFEKRERTIYSKISRSVYFGTLNHAQQQSIKTRTKWIKKNAHELATIAGIHPTHFESLFAASSNYSHCEAYALSQIHAADTVDVVRRFRLVQVIETLIFVGATLNAFGKLYSPAMEIIDRHPVMKSFLENIEWLKKQPIGISAS